MRVDSRKVLSSAPLVARLIEDGMITHWPHETTAKGRQWLRHRSQGSQTPTARPSRRSSASISPTTTPDGVRPVPSREWHPSLQRPSTPL